MPFNGSDYDPDLFLDNLIEGSMDDLEIRNRLRGHERMDHDPEADPRDNPYDDNIDFNPTTRNPPTKRKKQ